jgi:hypothetical protein
MIHVSQKTIDEVAALAEFDRKRAEQKEKQETQEKVRCVSCPDCGADLRIESKEDLPEDVKLVFVRHYS